MDPELRFTRHIEHTANKALRKLSILRKLCGTTWGSKPKTVKHAFCSISTKIIIGAVSSSNNNKAKQECGLPPLVNRRNLATIKFANRIRSNKRDYISTRVFNEWKGSTRLKRSSTLQLDKDIRSRINLEHSSLDFVQEPLFPRKPPSETKFSLNLYNLVQKRKEDFNILNQKALIP
ncbi:reverse transcriptase domain-containing protein [Caerostris extrusa]|uniref:Reverse transcriptase domain-containing protein n=1 Tax=Caerostris extrusa TaxID=172846 RepID=A0AAV4RPN0_CAEEX|nr:reverse transcriptase domain-containing protein [Caerostris extrusa]